VTGEKDSLARSLCWNCQSDVGGEYFCDQCIKIQPAPPELDYFQRFDVPRHLSIDLHDLERRYHQLSRKFHPDLFQRSSDQEKAISLEISSLLNKAYGTLRDPITRVEYLIRLEEGAVKDIPAKAPPDLLEEILELHETLERYGQLRKTAPDKAVDVQNILLVEKGRIADRITTLEKELFELFDPWDRWQDQRDSVSPDQQKQGRALLERMKDLISARSYLRTLLQDLNSQLSDKT
jgi:molecular chaperone HscB